jgi:hypothetical protein
VYRSEIKVSTEYEVAAPRNFYSRNFVDLNPRDFFNNNLNIIKQNENFYNFCSTTFQKNCEKIILKNIVAKKLRSSIYDDWDNYNLEFVIKFYYTSSLDSKEIFSNYIAHVFDNSYNKLIKNAYSFSKKKLEENEKTFQQYFNSLKISEDKDKQLFNSIIEKYINNVNEIKENLVLINKNEKENFYKISIMYDKKLFFSNNIILLFGLFVSSFICLTILFFNKK